MARVLMKGNDALAEAAVRAGCRFFGGYPITPQSEILEYLSRRMPEVGGHFVQAESELAGIAMVQGASSTGFRAMSSSSGPGFSLQQEGISYIASSSLPAVFIDVQRAGCGLGDIHQAQEDYFQAVKGGGHGAYRVLVYAPASIQENVDLTILAFDKAEQYMNPVLILSDAAIASMMEPVRLPEMREHDPDTRRNTVKGMGEGPNNILTTPIYYRDDYDSYIQKKYADMALDEERWEEFETEDAELVLVAYGVASRVCKEAVVLARRQGVKLGLVRPITLWPFPASAFRGLHATVSSVMTVELTPLPMMHEDVLLSLPSETAAHPMPVGSRIPEPQEIINNAVAHMRGTKQGGHHG